MFDLLSLLEEADFCLLSFLVGSLLMVSMVMIGRQPALKEWGQYFAAAVFLFYGVRGIFQFGLSDALSLIALLSRSLLAAGFGLGVAWIALSVITCLIQTGQTLRAWKRKCASPQAQPQLTGAEVPVAQPVDVGSSSKVADDARRLQAEQRRRDQIRADCNLLYQKHALDIEERFPKTEFDAFMSTYMSDAETPTVIRKRAKQLAELIESHCEKTQPTESFSDLETLAHWFNEQKSLIESMQLDDSHKHDFLVSLNERHAELTSRLLENMEP